MITPAFNEDDIQLVLPIRSTIGEFKRLMNDQFPNKGELQKITGLVDYEPRVWTLYTSAIQTFYEKIYNRNGMRPEVLAKGERIAGAGKKHRKHRKR